MARDLTRALRHLYLDKPNRLEIIAMVSINNIGEGQAPEDIIQERKDMKELVKGHSLYYDRGMLQTLPSGYQVLTLSTGLTELKP